MTNTPDATAVPMPSSRSRYGHLVIRSSSSYGAASVMLCCSAPLASSGAPLRPSVHYRSIGQVVIAKYFEVLVCTSCNPINIHYIFDQTCTVSKSGRSLKTSRMPTSSLVLLPCLSPPDATAKPMASSHHLALPSEFELFWRCLCEARLSSSSALVRNTHLCRRLVLRCRKYRVALNMVISSYFLRTQWIR